MSFCPYGEEDGPGRGCLRPEGHTGAHLIQEPTELDELTQED